MPPRQSVAPNDIQNLFPHSQRVPLGSEGHTAYEGTVGPGGAGQYWFYIPTTDPGTVLVMLDGGPADVRLVPERAIEVKRDPGTLRFQIPVGGEGIFHLYVTPARAVRVRFICEGWPKERDGKPLIPWNFWYFPFNSTSKKKGTFDSAAVQQSAMQKYDRAFHPHLGGPTWDWEKKNHVQPNAAGWEGHCGMAAYASVYFEQPPATAEVNEAVVGDFGPTKPERTGLEIWNVALVYFAIEWKEMPLQRRDPRACNVSIAIVTNADTYPQDAPSAPAEIVEGNRLEPSRFCQVFQHELELRYDGSGLLQKTRWLSCGAGGGRLFAPHMLVNVLDPAAPGGSGNPFVGDELLRAGTLRLRPRFKKH